MKFTRSMRYVIDNLLFKIQATFTVLVPKQLDRQQQYLEILKNARVVGMTTTGAAIHQELLNKLKAPVVFVEEAAEVLESNLLATLTPHVKHLVLIGDHKQLKPQVYLCQNVITIYYDCIENYCSCTV